MELETNQWMDLREQLQEANFLSYKYRGFLYIFQSSNSGKTSGIVSWSTHV